MGGGYPTSLPAINPRSKLLKIAALVLALVLAGSLWGGCGESFDGPPEIVPAQLLTSGAALSLSPIADGDSVRLVQPVQGGYVLFIGVLGRNLSTRSASLRGALRRSQASDGTPLDKPGGVLYFDERSVGVQPLSPELKPPTAAPGWQQVLPEPNDTANIPACPNPLDADVVDNPLFLEVTYKDGQGRSASAVHKVVPRCMQDETEERAACICQCMARYTTTRCFRPPDAG